VTFEAELAVHGFLLVTELDSHCWCGPARWLQPNKSGSSPAKKMSGPVLISFTIKQGRMQCGESHSLALVGSLMGESRQENTMATLFLQTHESTESP
jgi:hypothetical protein